MTTESPQVPRTFFQYVRSIGPGIVIALTWLGAGDLVDSAVAGGTYGYALMWAMALGLFVRFVFVSIIAKYQLCNQHQESVLAGLKRIHPIVPIIVGLMALIFSHFYGAFSVKGAGQTTAGLFGFPQEQYWDEGFAVMWAVIGFIIVYQGAFVRIEKVALVLLAMLSVSLIGVALWAGPNPIAAAKGVFLFQQPEDKGPYGVALVVVSLIGAVGGSIANLLYPYFIQQKGWKGPRYRRLQLYDLAFGTLAVVILNMAVWTVGAEILKPENIIIKELSDLTQLLTQALGPLGGPIFYAGAFAALFSTMVGNATGYGYMLTDISRLNDSKPVDSDESKQFSKSRIYIAVAAWSMFSPLVWCLPNMPGFVFLTVVVNAATVIILPLLAAGLWYITAIKKCIGEKYKNNVFENALMLFLFCLSCWGAWGAFNQILIKIGLISTGGG
ncbi:MAG: hypothetical protein CMJ77_14755 [Planctomycetaceae bacterium]|nr:hypothetical protein [Planctomycetaceae bacterium]